MDCKRARVERDQDMIEVNQVRKDVIVVKVMRVDLVIF